MTIEEWIGQVDAAVRAMWTDYHAIGFTVLGVAGLAVLLATAIVAKARKKAIKPAVIFLGTNLGLLLNAEGMWFVLTDPEKADVPKGFAVLVFAVFEIALMIAMDQARASYRATAVRHVEDGVDSRGRPFRAGDIKLAGTAGSALYVVWFIALLSGTIVATNGGSTTTVILRLGLPVVIVLLWWISVTAEAVTLKRRTTFKYSPYRVGVRRGWWAPEDDLDDSAERMREEAARANEARMAEIGHKIASGSLLDAMWRRRLAKLALAADEGAVERAAARVDRARTAVERIVGPVREQEQNLPEQVEVSRSEQVFEQPVEHVLPAAPVSLPATELPAVEHVPAPPVEPAVEQVREQEAGDGSEQVTPPAPSNGRRAARPDAEVIAEFDEVLRALAAEGKLTDHRVRTACKVSQRQSARIIQAVQERVNGAAVL